MLTFSGYHINEKLYESANSLVYRARRQADDQAVVLKMLKEDYPSPEKIAWFTREYEITHNLALAGVVNAYSLEHDQNRWVIVLEDFGGESFERLNLAGQLALPDFLTLAIDITGILGQIHQQYIMHKDINPSNIVLNPTSGRVKIIDFGISTVLSREDATFRNPRVLEGTLAYVSPEQTGRMNRAIDHRTDFYSLGVTFYELLTGQRPFAAEDALELVHCHIAQQPTAPNEHKADIPAMVAEVVLKLLAKNAEARYQSAYGLEADLKECLRQWQAQGHIDPFQLGQYDVSDRFQLPQTLYGREREIDMLLAAFERVSPAAPQGGVESKAEMMLVAGYAGIGKTALVQEVYKPITRSRGYFVTGKFDQLQRNVPYVAMIQAFRSLMHQLLTESEAEIGAWRQKLLAALGSNGQVIIAVIPELELIIGPQPDVPDLPPLEGQNRFNLVFQNFIQVFTQPEHPLVVFLDDLQWADGASLKLIQLLMTAVEHRYLFFIGAYRDNEVSAAHPLLLTLDEIKQTGTRVNQISLSPLDLPHVTQFIADAFNCALETAQPLAELVLAKTGGNPFFIIEFLKSLYSEELLTFVRPSKGDESEGRGWQWELTRIQARDITDNVVELLAGKVHQLPETTQHVLQLAACIGDKFDLQTLAIVYEKSGQETANALWPALTEGLILPLNDAYKLVDLEVEGLVEAVNVDYRFAHDRIQQAVYSLISEENKKVTHRRVGKLLLQNTTLGNREDRIFDIVNQLNAGKELIEDQAEQDELAQLNLKAGQKAKASVAYQAALDYLQHGLGLSGQDAWQRQYKLTLELYEEASEAAYLSGEFEEMARTSDIVLTHAKVPLDKVKVYEVQIQVFTAQGKLEEAVNTALQILDLLGVSFPEQPGQEDIGAAIQEVHLSLGDRSPADIINLPEMTDPYKLAAMRILMAVYNASYANAVLFSLMVCKEVLLSLQYGNCAESAFAYNSYGMILTSGLNNIDAGYEFGQLALDLVERLNARKYETTVRTLNYFFLRHGKEHLAKTLDPLQETYQIGWDSGNIDFAAGALTSYGVNAYLVSEDLETLERNLATYHQAISQIKQKLYLSWFEPFQQAVLNWRGEYAEQPWILVGKVYDETEPLGKDNPSAYFNRHFNKLILCYRFGEFHQAVDQAIKADEVLMMVAAGTPLELTYCLYHSLALLALFAESTKSEKEEILKKVTANQEKVNLWAQHAPMNYLHKYHLVEAERARVLGNDKEARDYYDQAIELAHEHKYLNEESLAYELAARFYLERGQSRLARYYMRDAHYAYRRWGAVAKVKDLEKKYPQLLAPAGTTLFQTTTSTTSTTTTQTSSALDLASVLKASQAISGEIELDKLLIKLMSVVIENAGAQRGYLVLKKNGHWVIEAEGTIEEIKSEGQPTVTALQAIPVDTYDDRLSSAVVNYVARTREDVVLNDAAREGLFTQDPYVTQNQPKSILCTPLINQGKLTGILYLENNLTTGAFTADRLEVLNLLSAQAAISIENASLYSHQVALTTGYSRFVPPEFLRFLSKESIVEVRLGDHVQQEMTVLFSDIRSFTTLSEMMTPQENFDFVNAYFGRVSPVIRQHDGIIVKYLGDGMMAVFPRRVEDALNAAIAKVKQVDHFNQDRESRGEVPIRIGIGIHTGKMTLGTVGEPERMQSDFLSDAVNLTARLEGLTKLYGASIVISQEALNRIEDPLGYQFRFLDRVQVKGRHGAVAVFEVFGGEPEAIIRLKLETRTKFEEGLTFYYGQQFAEAGELFNEVLTHNPDDQAAKHYLERSEHYLVHGAPADWAGVRVLDEK